MKLLLDAAQCGSLWGIDPVSFCTALGGVIVAVTGLVKAIKGQNSAAQAHAKIDAMQRDFEEGAALLRNIRTGMNNQIGRSE